MHADEMGLHVGSALPIKSHRAITNETHRLLLLSPFILCARRCGMLKPGTIRVAKEEELTTESFNPASNRWVACELPTNRWLPTTIFNPKLLADTPTAEVLQSFVGLAVPFTDALADALDTVQAQMTAQGWRSSGVCACRLCFCVSTHSFPAFMLCI